MTMPSERVQKAASPLGKGVVVQWQRENGELTADKLTDAGFQRIQGRVMDERAVPELSAAGARLRRLPLPAFHLTGDVAATDPACSLAPRHDVVVRARAESRTSLRYRAPGA